MVAVIKTPFCDSLRLIAFFAVVCFALWFSHATASGAGAGVSAEQKQKEMEEQILFQARVEQLC